MWGWFDPVYFVFLAPGVLLALWAQFRVQSAYQEASRIPARSGLSSLAWVKLGIIAFSTTVVFQLVNLPVEFDASRRARLALVEGGLIGRDEDATVKRVLDAAALTYVAATLTSVLTLLYFLFRA